MPILTIALTAIFATAILAPMSISNAYAHGYEGEDVLSAYADNANVKRFTLIADESNSGTLLPTGDAVFTMSFNGTIPAPVIRVTQGDVVEITLINNGDEPHSIDQHASQITAVPNFGAVQPGETKTYTFVAANAGVFAYHCEANDVHELDEHALLGMEGMLIVDPKEGYDKLKIDSVVPLAVDMNVDSKKKTFDGPAREFSLLYSEVYYTNELTDEEGTDSPVHVYDKSKMMHNDPTYTTVNGIPFGYLGPLLSLPVWQDLSLDDVIPGDFLLDCTIPALCSDVDGDGTLENNPPLAVTTIPGLAGTGLDGAFGSGSITAHLDANMGDHVRFFVQNTGDRPVAWHIVGEQLDRVTMGENVMTTSPIQTWNIGSYQDATIDVVFEQPGVYAIVNHDYSSLFKGQASIVIVHNPAIDPNSCASDDLVCNVIAGAAVENPSNAVPPASGLHHTSMPQNICKYGIGSETANTFTSECYALDIQNPQ
jgi:nitrite reductase (NO-forming)